MAKKTVDFNKTGIGELPNNKPVVYKILTEGRKNNYTGIAQKGRVQERISEHLSGGKDYVPDSKVQIEQMKSSVTHSFENLIDKIIHGDNLTILKSIPTNSINLIITSPPYFKQRD